MPSDARLGLVAGVSLVIVAAVLFCRKEPPPADPNTMNAKPAPAATPPPITPLGNGRSIAAKTTARPASTAQGTPSESEGADSTTEYGTETDHQPEPDN
jgi:hypothetical protein